jgi:hypothetical protein
MVVMSLRSVASDLGWLTTVADGSPSTLDELLTSRAPMCGLLHSLFGQPEFQRLYRVHAIPLLPCTRYPAAPNTSLPHNSGGYTTPPCSTRDADARVGTDLRADSGANANAGTDAGVDVGVDIDGGVGVVGEWSDDLTSPCVAGVQAVDPVPLSLTSERHPLHSMWHRYAAVVAVGPPQGLAAATALSWASPARSASAVPRMYDDVGLAPRSMLVPVTAGGVEAAVDDRWVHVCLCMLWLPRVPNRCLGNGPIVLWTGWLCQSLVVASHTSCAGGTRIH